MATVSDWQSAILVEVGAGLDGNDVLQRQLLDKLTPQIGFLWSVHQWRAAQGPQIQYLYTKRHAIDWLMGQLRHMTNASVGGFNPRMGEKLENLDTLRKNCSADIEAAEAQAAASRPAVIGQLTAVAPVVNERGRDPNDRAYRGDAVKRAPYTWPPY